MVAATRWLLGPLALPAAVSDYFPIDDHLKYFPPWRGLSGVKPEADCHPSAWDAPKMQPWDLLRALPDSVSVSWMPAWHPWCEVNHYHLETRRPKSFPLRFADLEGLQHRELDVETDHQEFPGDAEWTDWELTYSGLSRAFTFNVDTSRGHAVQFRVRACGRRLNPRDYESPRGFDLKIVSTYSDRPYEIVPAPNIGMLTNTDRDYVAADLGYFTYRNGFIFVRTPMADKDVPSGKVLITLHCPTACHVYLHYDYQVQFALRPWFAADGWTPVHDLPRPYPRIETMYKLWPAGNVRIYGNDDRDWARGLPLIFVKQAGCPKPSAWSEIQTTHTVLSASVDKINFYIRGTGKNAPDFSIIKMNRQVLYKRRDQTGLVLAVFSRLDLSLKWLETYDTHRNRTASLQMSKDIRMFNQSYFVVVLSTIAWEWRCTRTLAHTMEYCGAYHFGQWVHIFAEQPHYASPESDLQQDASQDEFGHPYAFIGIPGIGTGQGWESLMYNTGQYAPKSEVNTPKAIIRGVAYYDYVARIFRLQDMVVNKVGFFEKNQPPGYESIHQPIPVRKAKPPPVGSLMLARQYAPYVGTMRRHITSVIEANQTVPPFNYAFSLTTVAGVRKVDPRPKSMYQTELERLWSGPSARYWPHNGSLFHPGLLFLDRNCTEYLSWGYAEASPEGCGNDFACQENQPINDFSSKAAMEKAGWTFTTSGGGAGTVPWNNALSFKPDKWRYDLSNEVPYTSFWGLDNPRQAELSLVLRGKGTLTISFGNCWQYSLGYVELKVNGVRRGMAYSLQINKVVTLDFQHKDVLSIREYDAVMVLNSIYLQCWGCCKTVDHPNVIATMCSTGVTPTLCRDVTNYQLKNFSHFSVIDTHSLSTGGLSTTCRLRDLGGAYLKSHHYVEDYEGEDGKGTGEKVKRFDERGIFLPTDGSHPSAKVVKWTDKDHGTHANVVRWKDKELEKDLGRLLDDEVVCEQGL